MGTSYLSPHTKTAYLAQARLLYEKAGQFIQHEGRHWYLREHKEALGLAEGTGHPLRIVCACLAVLSPRCHWRRVKKACKLLLEGREHQAFSATTGPKLRGLSRLAIPI